ncbi:MAG TPA: ferrous iron transport protein B [Spirochaetales bacterium]|nr:ferrous iron transport protein B [Spirochaetales bacterium]
MIRRGPGERGQSGEAAHEEPGKRHLHVALAGNPNAGKTSLFNALTGAHHKVGNYPGVTVEKREGTREYGNLVLHIVDLPGTYSLTAYSLDDVVARDFVLEEKPDLIVDVLDSTNLERNLNLCLQFQELGVPLVGALNMSDEAEAKGLHIDADKLSKTLGIPLVKTVGTDGKGIDALLSTIERASRNGTSGKMPSYGPEIEKCLAGLEKMLLEDPEFSKRYPPRWLAIKLLENDQNAIQKLGATPRGEQIRDQAEAYRLWIKKHFGKDSEIVITEQRYGYIHGALAEAVRKTPVEKISPTEKIDRVLMNKFLGLPMFLLIIWGIFKLTFTIGAYPVAWLESAEGALIGYLGQVIPPGLLRSFVVNGIVGGVGGVLSFVPLIVLLFLCISIMEDTGYMSRAAFLTDRILHSFGLHGQSFMPMILGFGCSVPAIMSTRTLKSPKDRIATILAVPFMSCGAKLPVYVLLAGAFFPRNAANVVMAIYLGGVVLSFLSTVFLRKTVLRGKTTPFVMELPPYRLPTVQGIFWHVWEKTWQYVKKAGTVILAASIIIWALTTFPLPKGGPYTDEYKLEYSVAGRIGKFIEPAIRPLGFNWKIGVALIPGFTAKELIVSTLGILYGNGGQPQSTEVQSSNTGQATTAARDTTASLTAALNADPTMSPLVALSLMVFVLVMPPCLASIATIKSEAGSKWALFEIGYALGLAWIMAFLIRVIGGLV